MVREGYLNGLIVTEMEKEDFLGWPVETNGLSEGSPLLLADKISKGRKLVSIGLISGASIVGRSLGIKADRDCENEVLGYDVIGIESIYSGNVYAVPEWIIDSVERYAG